MMAQEEKNKDRKDNRTSNLLMLCHFVVLAAAIAVVVKIFILQFVWEPGDTWMQFFGMPARDVKEVPDRGDILSHDGKVLAMSIPLFQIRMDCKIRKQDYADLDDPQKNPGKYHLAKGAQLEAKWREKARALSAELADLMGDMDADAYYDLIISNRDGRSGGRDVMIGHVIDQPTLLKVRKLTLFNEGKYKGGLKIDTLDTRQYPYDALAYRAIGKVTSNAEINNTNIGLEGKYDYLLHGEDGLTHKIITDGQTFIRDDSREHDGAVPGADIRTTLDIEFTSIVEQELRRHIAAEEDIQQGCAMVMDVKTGAIRSMVNLRRDDSGNIGESWNFCIGEANHPGSVFKTVSLMMAIDDNDATLNTTVPAAGNISYHGHNLEDHHLNHSAFPSGYVTLGEGLMISSNNVFRQVAIKYYDQRPEEFVAKLYEYKLMENFDFDINGLAKATCKNPKDKMTRENPTGWSPLDLPQMAFGYSLRVTPLHVLTYYNAIANDGKMMKPYMVESFERDGKIIEQRKPEVLNAAICKKETARMLKEALLMVTYGFKSDQVRGTAYWAFRDCKVKIAGKTGTAFLPFEHMEGDRKVNDDMDNDGRRVINGSFVGFFPADAPQYTAIVVFKTKPTIKNIEGFRCARCMNDIVNRLYTICPQWQETLPASGQLPDFLADTEER